MRIKLLAVALALTGISTNMTYAQDVSCTSSGHIVISKILGNDGRAQIVAEASDFCTPFEALAAGLAAGFEAQRAEYMARAVAEKQRSAEPKKLAAQAAPD